MVLEDYVGDRWPMCTPGEMELLEKYLERTVIRQMAHRVRADGEQVVTDLGRVFEVLQGERETPETQVETTAYYVLAMRDESVAMRQLKLLCAVKRVPLVPMNRRINGLVAQYATSGYHGAMLLLREVVEQDSGLLALLDSVEQPPAPWLEDLQYKPANIKV
ncbi:hypothetical protein RNJ44_02472 [Nakaseomyces bracarensis]|uniref:Uncharacterized protein n=2 Tax=Nakaseomyces bracarensis TaxID=273131 RepID=A0ABR4NLS9_9SACH